jgi:ATP-binding cassette subfamily F protein 3
MTRAEKLSVAYFAQHQLDELNEDGTVYEHVRKLMLDAKEAAVRGKAGAIGFSAAAAETRVANLSGGEKARLLLGLATFFGPNLIILDEPTNHLDIDSRAALAEAINDFPGAVIMVSHDRFLIETCADRLWLVANGKVTPYDGDIDDYRRDVLNVRGRKDDDERGRAQTRPIEAPQPKPNDRARKKPPLQKVADVEAEIARISGIIARVDAALALPDLFQRDPEKAAQLAKARSAAANALHEAEERWLSLSSALEADS